MKKTKVLLTVLVLVLAVFVLAGCSEKATPYQINDAEGYQVSVKFDANGGYFGTNTYVIVDAYNISEMEKNSEGNAEIALLPPENPLRGIDAYEAKNPGYFLAGWYAERTETAEGYTYGQKWDFEADRLSLDPAKTYSSQEPVMTLYAVWVPEFEIEFYDLDSGELLNTHVFNPTQGQEFQLPHWDEETGAIEMYQFPARDGYTFQNAYYDPEGTQAVSTETLVHPGTVDIATGTAKDPTLKLYIGWMEGEWYQIYNADQFLDNASVSGNYVIHNDLDFEGKIWPTSLVYGNFTGTIQGNGHTLSNIAVEQTNNSKVNAGLFGYLAEGAQIRDLTFNNVTFTIKAGTRVAGTSYGLLAGTISEKAALTNVAITAGQLLIDASCYFGTEDYIIGLLCGMGNPAVDGSGITCSVIGEGLYATVTDGIVTLSNEPVESAGETLPQETQEA